MSAKKTTYYVIEDRDGIPVYSRTLKPTPEILDHIAWKYFNMGAQRNKIKILKYSANLVPILRVSGSTISGRNKREYYLIGAEDAENALENNLTNLSTNRFYRHSLADWSDRANWNVLYI